jgi:hypothetical protein
MALSDTGALLRLFNGCGGCCVICLLVNHLCLHFKSLFFLAALGFELRASLLLGSMCIHFMMGPH